MMAAALTRMSTGPRKSTVVACAASSDSSEATSTSSRHCPRITRIQIRYRPFGGGGVPVPNRNRPIVVGQAQGRGPPQPIGAAGHDGDTTSVVQSTPPSALCGRALGCTSFPLSRPDTVSTTPSSSVCCRSGQIRRIMPHRQPLGRRRLRTNRNPSASDVAASDVMVDRCSICPRMCPLRDGMCQPWAGMCPLLPTKCPLFLIPWSYAPHPVDPCCRTPDGRPLTSSGESATSNWSRATSRPRNTGSDIPVPAERRWPYPVRGEPTGSLRRACPEPVEGVVSNHTALNTQPSATPNRLPSQSSAPPRSW